MKKFFGTDGIRGKAYEFLTPELAYQVGLSLQLLRCKELIIGRDTRESGKMLSLEIEKGATEAGIKVRNAGIVSTPMLSYLSKRKNTLGVMITGSHNPYHDNGIKVFKYGKKLSEKEEEEIEAVLNGIKVVNPEVKAELEALDDAFSLYLELYQELFNPTNLKIGLDLANGATYEIGKKIFQNLNPNIKVIADQPDGKNINQDCGSTRPESLINLVLENALDLGFAFDGDGDRLLVVNHDGRIFDGDHLIYVYANYLKEKGLLPGNTVVLTKMSNLGIIKALKAKGINVLLTDVGDKYVFKALEEYDYVLGGEASGHIINLNLLDTGDGVLNAVYLIKILEESSLSLEEIVQEVKMYPERTYNLKDVDKGILKNPYVLKRIEAIKAELGDNGKVLVRPSGTEPVIRVTVSAENSTEVDYFIDDIVLLLKNTDLGEI
jgi:phosphoglucosamine mutase